MNRSFENIFEKYNITYKTPRKRKKFIKLPTQSIAMNKNKQSLFTNRNETSNSNVFGTSKATCSNVSNTTTHFYFNTSTKGKYFRPTRYNTLNVVPVKNFHNSLNSSASETSIFSDSLNNSACEWSLKQNILLQAMDKENKVQCCVNNTLISSIDCKRKALSCSFNLGRKCKQNNKNHNQSSYKSLNITVIPKRNKPNDTFENEPFHDILNESSTSFKSSLPEPSQIIETPSQTEDDPNNKNTELDLLIDLIEREDKIKANKENINKNSESNDILPLTKTCLKGGYEELFERALKREKVRGKFLKHDRKVGLRVGKPLTVVNLETAYGVTLAVVKSEDLNKNFGIVVAPEMVPLLQLGTLIEAFFDENSQPYIVQDNEDFMEIYLEPYKILVV